MQFKKHILIPAAGLVLAFLSSCTTRCVMFTSYQAAIDYYAQGGERSSPTIHFTRPFIRYDDFPEKHKEEIEARRKEIEEKRKAAGLPPLPPMK